MLKVDSIFFLWQVQDNLFDICSVTHFAFAVKPNSSHVLKIHNWVLLHIINDSLAGETKIKLSQHVTH